jgi:hypothetical protein
MGPHGELSVLRSKNDKSPASARKAISAVMILKKWSFEQAVAWMTGEFGAEATRNSAHEYFDILLAATR